MKSRNVQNQKDNSLSQLSQGGGFASRPKALRCSICGREFGTASLEIHQKTCIKKYANDLTNMEVAHRVNMPSTKQVMQKLQQEKALRTQGLNNGQKGMYIPEQASQVMALVQCRRCGRRFNPDRIRKHESVCIGPEPDLGAIKQNVIDQNKKAARKLRPKKTGKWQHEHLEFQQAMKLMRQVRKQEQMEQGGGYYGNKNQQSRVSASNRQQQQQQYPQYPQYSQSTKMQSSRQPVSNNRQQLQISSKQQPIQQKPQVQGKQSIRSTSGTVKHQSTKYEDKQPSYGRPTGGGGGGSSSYQIANSNVSTFSLFTNDGKPPVYDQFQRSNPYAKKNGLY